MHTGLEILIMSPEEDVLVLFNESGLGWLGEGLQVDLWIPSSAHPSQQTENSSVWWVLNSSSVGPETPQVFQTERLFVLLHRDDW